MSKTIIPFSTTRSITAWINERYETFNSNKSLPSVLFHVSSCDCETGCESISGISEFQDLLITANAIKYCEKRSK